MDCCPKVFRRPPKDLGLGPKTKVFARARRRPWSSGAQRPWSLVKDQGLWARPKTKAFGEQATLDPRFLDDFFGKIRTISMKIPSVRGHFPQNRKNWKNGQQLSILRVGRCKSQSVSGCRAPPKSAAISFFIRKNKCFRVPALHTPAGDGHPPGARRRPYLPRSNGLSSLPLG